jgi:hypothetical protein
MNNTLGRRVVMVWFHSPWNWCAGRPPAADGLHGELDA